jgi:hypothetical protein
MVRAELMAGTDEYDEVAPFRAKMLVEHKAYQRTASCVAAKYGC